MKNSDIDNKNMVVYGICPSRQVVEDVVTSLKRSGFRSADISVLFSSPETSKEFAHQKDTKAPEGAMVGGSAGAIIGGTLGWLAGIGAVAIPGVGPFIAAGPIMGMLAGAGAGSVVGGVSGALVGLGFPEYEAKRFEGRINDGGILISVHADNAEWRDKAREILEDHAVEDISSSSETSADYGDKDIPRVHNY